LTPKTLQKNSSVLLNPLKTNQLIDRGLRDGDILDE
jgi:hypothetical protein